MALDIAQLRAAFAKKNEGGEGASNAGFWDRFYPFYKMGFDEVATIRFLQDADEENPLGFIVENKYHEFFVNGKKKKIACLKMYGEACPCCDKSGEFYNAGDSKTGKMFWRKIDYIAQALVINSPFEYPVKADDNPVRLISMSKQLYENLETEIVKGDLDAMPYDMETGYDFRILKTKKIVPDDKGGPAKEYGNYDSSGFARKATPLPASALSNEKFELLDLKKFRFAKVEREAMEAMIEAALTGKSYDEGAGATPTNQVAAVAAAVESPKATQPAETVLANVAAATPAATPAAEPGKKLSPAEILAKLKANRPS